MKLSTEHGHYFRAYRDEEALDILKAAGYDAVDMSLFCMSREDNVFNTPDYKKRALEIRAHADKIGMPFNQSHTPFRSKAWTDPVQYEEFYLPQQIRALEIAGIMGCENVVIHPLHDADHYKGHEDETFEINMKYYRRLLPYAKDLGVRIVTENMWGRNELRKCITPSACGLVEEFIRYVDGIDDESFGACLDLGHCGLVGEEAEDAIRALGKDRLKALHVHDNKYWDDNHTAPGLGKMHWEEIMKALAEIDYEGDLTMESDGLFKYLPPALFGAADRFLVEIGRYLIGRFEHYKQAK